MTRFLFLPALLVLLLPVFMKPAAAQVKLYPSLTVMEIYDDNLYNDEKDQISEFVTRLMPSIALDYQAPRVDLDIAYTFDYRYYAKDERDNEDVHFLDTVALFNWNETAFLEIFERYSRVSLDSTRDYREESLFENQSDQNIFSISPYLQLNPTARSRLRAGYQFAVTTYEDQEGNDRKENRFFLEGSRDLTSRLRADLGYKYIDQDVDDGTDRVDYDKHDLWTGLRYEYGENSLLFGTVGHTWIDFANGVEQSDLFWDFGLTHDLRLVVVTAALGVHYLEDPEGSILREESYRLTATRDWERSRLTLSGSLSNYYDPDIDRMDTRRYGGSATLTHELSSRLTGTASFSGFKWEERIDDTWTRRLIGSLGFSYLFTETFTGTLTWYGIDSHSPQLPDDRYETNRFFLEARKVF